MNAPRFHTLGCRLNAFETEAMAALADKAGLDDVVVVNSCAVTSEAMRKTRQEIRKLRRSHPTARIVVTGCAAQTDPSCFAAMGDVDIVLGNAEKMDARTWVALASEDAASQPVQVGDIMSARGTPNQLIDGLGTRARAYVQIQNGCDHRCTFCIIPYGRGNSRSTPADQVVTQVARLAARGYCEVVLSGVDITAWGDDLPGHPRLGDLVLRILRLVPDLPRLRLSSIDSIEVDDALWEAIATEPRLMPHLHLSLQHGDDLILKRMKRRHLRDNAIRFTEKVRQLRPDMVFGADIIAGFPTETEEQFQRSLELIEACSLTWLHVFPYSARPGTPAARMPQLDRAVIRDRAGRLRAQGQVARAGHLAMQVGKTHQVLMESTTMGRTAHFAEVAFCAPHPPGKIIKAQITNCDDARLFA